METKYSKDSEIHFMEENKPKSGVITGITMKTGKGEGLHDKFDVKDGEFEVIYHIKSNWYGIKETDAYGSRADLQKAVFTKVSVNTEVEV